MADTASSGSRTRLDALLVQRGLFQTRSRARDAILRGTVTADGAVVTRPGQQIAQGTDIRIDDPARQWVSRAALKLAAGLDAFGFDPAGCTCLDIGASTGGFTQVLLARGASRVYAIDVGHGQMDAAVAADPRVVNLEGINARDLVAGDIGDAAPDFLVSDVSFISLKLALPPALGMAAPGARGIFLVKPQFEAGREAIGKGGLLRDPGQAATIADDLKLWLGAQAGWRAVGPVASPIEGGDGNVEYLIGGEKRS